MTKLNLDYKSELKTWAIFFATILLTVFAHEIGHCIPAWINGYGAIPTPAKSYPSSNIPDSFGPYFSAGGPICSVLISLTVLFFYIKSRFKYDSAILAGALASPALYTLKFIISGRGHDSTEFQETQSVLGLNYSGHSLDWIFAGICLVGIIVWLVKSKPGYKIIGRLIIGFVLTVIFLSALQDINNAIFDPIFMSK
jgi:hypothetical protein